MLRSSGIGTYLCALLPRVIRRLPAARFCLLGQKSELALESWVRDPRIECRELSAGVYSPLEQLLMPALAPRETRVFWSPHINIPLFSPGRLLVTVHDAFYLYPPAGLRTRLDKRLYLAALHRVIPRRAAAVLCVSQFTKSELERAHASWSCPLHAVPSGVDEAWFERPTGERPWPKPYLLYVGNLKPHKNLPRTLAAFARVAPGLEHDFLLVGNGDADALSRELSPAVAPRVAFLGSLPEPELRRYVAHASGLVLASLYEGFGLPPLEAMALAVPTLVSRVASLPEVCGDAALYCDPLSVEDIARSLQSLLSDGELRARLTQAGPLRARLLNWDRTAEKTCEVLSSLLEA